MASSLETIIVTIFQVFNLVIVARILISWVSPDPRNQIYRVLCDLTEPILAPVRRRLPPTGTVDLSPLVVLVGSFVLGTVLVALVRALF